MRCVLLFALLTIPAVSLFAQTPIVSGLFSSETEAIEHGEVRYLLVKKYEQPRAEGAENAHSKGTYTYLDLPVQAYRVSANGDVFKTYLYALDHNDQVLWLKYLGRHYGSWPTAMAVDDHGMVYVGEKRDTGLAILLARYDSTGKQLWTTTVDSLDSVHGVVVDHSDSLTVLASRTLNVMVENGDGTSSIQEVLLFHTLRIGKATGEIHSVQYNEQLSAFNQGMRGLPIQNGHWLNLALRRDTLGFYMNFRDGLSIATAHGITGVSVEKVFASNGEHTLVGRGPREGVVRLSRERYSKTGSRVDTIDVKVERPWSRLVAVRNELDGFTLFCNGESTLIATKLDHDFNLLWQKRIDLGKKACDVVTSVSNARNGAYDIYYLKVVDQKRNIYSARIDKDGDLVKR